MKKIALYILAALLLYSCESQENKDSRLTLDKYTRKLNSMTLDVISSRKDEGSQSKLTLNNFYDRYTSKFENFNNDLDFETISEDYRQNRENIVAISRGFYDYLNMRKSAILDLTNAYSAYENVIKSYDDYKEYDEKSKTPHWGEYARLKYELRALEAKKEQIENTMEFNNEKYSYLNELAEMDTLILFVDSISTLYNQEVLNTELVDEVKIPEAFKDTINDWLLSVKVDLIMLDTDL